MNIVTDSRGNHGNLYSSGTFIRINNTEDTKYIPYVNWDDKMIPFIELG